MLKMCQLYIELLLRVGSVCDNDFSLCPFGLAAGLVLIPREF